ncbi:acetyltransferase [Sphaerochaeta pleomorpha str. Grapes]|uniref:Acetyltransferase n=1 Tax=Sphaerochaeta pleomorpha (strain ATCC BAA-1885 / DSM 22778 / Grapes) TaxID=158190 RepID=G8QY98_SPHPG|nr:GNAT family N-acetyltransferase [Sphaerochaeta pleomorpha]AEV29663.1 acetyltransferase [Sphaerochaeta pleomorpha str. Grapes]
MQETTYTIRLLQDGEEPELLALMRATFEPSMEKIFYIHPASTLVAEYDGQLVAGINLDIYPVNKNTKMGYIGWLYTASSHRGNGLAGKLIEQALPFLKEQGCTDVCACVEGDNPSSFKQLVRQGFSILSLKEQVQLFRFGILKVYRHASRFFDMGYFLYHYCLADPSETLSEQTPAKAFALTLLGNTVLWVVCLKGWNLLHLVGMFTGNPQWASGLTEGFNGPLVGGLPVVLLLVPPLFLIIRTLAMELSAKIQKIDLVYKGWDTAWITAFLSSFLIGFPFPVPGNLYIEGNDWDTKTMQPKLTMLARTSQLAIGIGCLFFADSFALRYPLTLLALDTLFFFYPFCGFNARRLHFGGPATKTSSLALLLAVSLFVLL